MPGEWEIAADADEVHALLCASDAAQATPEAPAPQRRMERTRRRVESDAVHLLRLDGAAAAMLTLTPEPPFGDDLGPFPPLRRPAYLSRLAVEPVVLRREPLVGARCVRRAIDLATAEGADGMRSEANPDFVRVLRLLTFAGFEQQGPIRSDGRRRRVGLQRPLP